TAEALGIQGSGMIVQTGGNHFATAIDLGTQAGSKGTYTLDAGTLTLVNSDTITAAPGIKIGGKGTGTFTIGNTHHTGTVADNTDRANVVVRGGSSRK